MEFHGYSVAEVKELLMFMRELSGSPDAARWTPGSAP